MQRCTRWGFCRANPGMKLSSAKSSPFAVNVLWGIVHSWLWGKYLACLIISATNEQLLTVSAASEYFPHRLLDHSQISISDYNGCQGGNKTLEHVTWELRHLHSYWLMPFGGQNKSFYRVEQIWSMETTCSICGYRVKKCSGVKLLGLPLKAPNAFENLLQNMSTFHW